MITTRVDYLIGTRPGLCILPGNSTKNYDFFFQMVGEDVAQSVEENYLSLNHLLICVDKSFCTISDLDYKAAVFMTLYK